jgi:hypothetical protein
MAKPKAFIDFPENVSHPQVLNVQKILNESNHVHGHNITSGSDPVRLEIEFHENQLLMVSDVINLGINIGMAFMNHDNN